MNKFIQTLTNTRGDVLPGDRLQVVTSAGAAVDIYADDSSTPFTDSDGNVVNYATADLNGLVEFYWTPASGQVLQQLDTTGTLRRAITDFAKPYLLSEFGGEVAQAQVTGLVDDLAAKAATADLASTDTGKGAALSGIKRPETGAADRTVYAKITEAWISPEDFRGNGETDNECLAKFAAALGNNVHGKIVQDYEVEGVTEITDKSNFNLVSGGNAKITIADGAGTSEAYSALQFTRCTDFTVEGVEIDGNRAGRTPAEASGHLVRIINCQRGIFRRVKANNGTTDGFFIASAATGNGAGGGPLESELPADLLFEQCSADGNWRNGMSIIDAYRLTVRGGFYSRTTGSWDASPNQGPGDGIDIEPDDRPTWIQDRVRDILIDGVLFEANQGWGLQVHHNNGVHNIVGRNCVFRDSERGAVEASSFLTLIDPYFDGWTDDDYTAQVGAPTKRGLVDIPAAVGGSGKIKLIRPRYRNIAATSSSHFAFYSHSSTPGGSEIIHPDLEGVGIKMEPRAPNEKIIGGEIIDCKGINSVGADAEIRGTFMEGCPSPSLQVQGARAKAIDVTIRNPSSDDTFGQIRVLGANSKVRGCKIKVDTPEAGYGIVAAAALDECVGNHVDGYTGNAFVFAAANVVQDNNNDNGTIIERDSIALADGATITPNLSLGRNFHVTLGGNRTLANPTNIRAGQRGRIRVTQDGTGSRTLAYGSAWKFPGGAPTLTTTAAAVDVIEYYVHTTSLIEASISKALA